LQSALVAPALKAAGFHVTYNTTPKGQDILKHDPNIDAWIINETDAIPNHELPAYWAEQAKNFDRFVNLSESIEGTLLVMPGRMNHTWPHSVRCKRMNLNYHEWTAELAGVPFKPAQLFYPSPEEMAEVAEALDPAAFNVVWALAGSSQHKFTPHMDSVIARMMLDMPEARVYFVGDDACKLLEQGWEDEKRVTRLSGALSIRKTLALAMGSNLVIGPETGVLNAVGMEQAPSKVLMLSHSSEHNLSKHWVNTQTLKPKGCACFPCHMLHYDMEFCDEDETTGAARCAVNIDGATIYEAVANVYRKWKKGKR
jgi:ADP-heptose:LPS heptosyltransferase